MQIIILGGAAQMAQPALRHLVKQEIVKEIVLTDLNEEGIKEIANQLGKKASFKKLNITNENELDLIMKKASLVMNFIGPYYRFRTLALEVAINNGVNYIDLCDDYDVTIESLELTDLAKEKGVTAITGMGASPGITNILARLGSDQLDRVDEINTYWVVGDAEPGGFGALSHMFHIMKGKIATFQDGKETWIRSFQQKNAKKIDFGEPVGEVTLYHVGHPEPVTLPRYIPNVKKVTNLGALLPEFQNPMFKVLVDLGFTSEKPIEFRGEQVAPLEFLLRLFEHKQSADKNQDKSENQSVSGAKIEVIGEKNGVKTVYSFVKSAYDKMDQGTSIPVGVVAVQLLNGEIDATGVIPPEGLNPKKVMHDLKEVHYFDEDKGFQVERSINGKTIRSSVIDIETFPELW